jgi:dipeptidyl aminopeptidase/acylaminoacyl peptidase
LVLIGIALFATVSIQGQTARRAITLDDHSRIINVGDPQRSPDGVWVAYTVTTIDAEKDRRNTDVWMVKWDGSEQLQLTSSPDGESSPRWSPDNKYLAFVASRGTDEEKKKGGQIWLLNRAGGEAQKVSDFKGGVGDIQWSPDSTRIAFTHEDEDPADEPEKMDGWKRKTAPPIVIDRYHFKEDRTGYLGNYYSHIGVFDVASKTTKMITKGNTDDGSPSWSPTASRSRSSASAVTPIPIARPTRISGWSRPRDGAEPRPVDQDRVGEGGRPAWSPDGSRIAALMGDDDAMAQYSMNKLIVVPSNPPAQIGATTRPTVYMPQLDRAVSNIAWSADGQNISFLLQDDRTNHVATVPAENPNGTIQRKTSGRRVIQALNAGKDGNFAVLAREPNKFTEVYALEGSNLRQLTKHNQKLLDELQLATTEDFQSKSKDGTDVHGLIVKPAGYKAGTKYPTSSDHPRRPNGQDQHSFSFDREFLAANGYVVLAINYRGSAGRGNAFQKAIHADWGNLESQDLIGAVDEAIKQGIADPAPARHRRLELRRHLDRQRDRERPALQGAGQRRRRRAGDVAVRRRPIHPPVRQRAGTSRGRRERRQMARSSYALLQRRQDQDADAVHGRREGLQRADRRRRADVSGAEEPRRRHAAGDLSRPVPRPDHSELRARSACSVT